MNGREQKIEEPQTCIHCGKILSSKLILERHIRRVHGNDKSHVCDECRKGFANKNDLKGHIDQSHSRKVCDHCGKSLLNRFFLKKHLVFDHGIKKGAFICDFCPRTVFFVKTVYEKHVKEKHSE